MAAFLSAEWIAALNEKLALAPAPPLEEGRTFLVVFDFAEAPGGAAHALTFRVSAEGASVEPGDHLGADTLVRLSFSDGEALTGGTLDSAAALREGRLKVSGDVHALVPLFDWLQAAKAATGSN